MDKQEFKISLAKFATSVRGTDEAIWVGPLRIMHEHSKFTKSEWYAVIEQLKAQRA